MKRKVDPSQFKLLFSFDVEEEVATVVEDVAVRAETVDQSLAQPDAPPAPRVIYDEGFKETPPRDVTDEPCPTVKIGEDALCSQHYIIEGDGKGSTETTLRREPRGEPLKRDVDESLTREKPPYRVPLMSEIRGYPWNGLTVVSTFSGCGGSCLGFKMAGYRVLWANEFVPAAQETYRANHTGTHLDTSDIRAVTAESIRSVVGDVEIDVLEGSPPCASFSTAGKTSKGWGKVRKYSDVEQRTDDLFEQYIRILDGLRPRVFVAENVAGMVKGVSKGFFKRYLKVFRSLPYNVEARLLDAQWLGVPQRRVRLIFVGVRKDVGHPAWPRKLPYRYSIRDAIPWIVRATSEPHGPADFESGFTAGLVDELRPAPTLPATVDGARYYRHDVQIVAGGAAPAGQRGPVDVDLPSPTVLSGGDGDKCQFFVEPQSALGKAVGAQWDTLGPGDQSDKYLNLIRPRDDMPCPTVTQLGGTSAASVTHPYERRKFSIAELRRICGFPDDFIFTGTYSQQWERMGRSVPPPMMRAVAEALVPVLKRS